MGDRLIRRGLLVALEGLDGVGKTTQIERLGAWLRERGLATCAVREPGGTPFGEALREFILHRVDAQSALAELLTFAAARAELMEVVVRPALAEGAVVLMDRFIDSSIAYQAFGRGLATDVVRTVNEVATQGQRPDLTIWLKGHPFALQRDADRLETRDAAYFRRVEAGYAWLVEQEPERWLVIDSQQPPDVIFDVLRSRIGQITNYLKGES
jgi:dTMP kinase